MTLEVIRADGLVTVQDLGRVGYADLGVPTAGALDPVAAALANRLVGNDATAAVLETTLLGLRVRSLDAVTVAVTGARCAVTAGGRARPFAEPFSLSAGTELELGPAQVGVRSYLAVAGGLDLPPVLGSRSTDTLAFVGPPVVEVGALLPVGTGGGPRPVDVSRAAAHDGPLRVRPGPRADWFAEDALELLTTQDYVVGSDSNRIGLRLAGRPLRRRVTSELPSEGLVLGAIQVPPDGQPVVMLADHPTTGGYPVVAVVEPEDLARCGQLRPGDRVRFTPWRPAPGAASGHRH